VTAERLRIQSATPVNPPNRASSLTPVAHPPPKTTAREAALRAGPTGRTPATLRARGGSAAALAARRSNQAESSHGATGHDPRVSQPTSSISLGVCLTPADHLRRRVWQAADVWPRSPRLRQVHPHVRQHRTGPCKSSVIQATTWPPSWR